eukprot:3654787-Prymnesium_polylepis.1
MAPRAAAISPSAARQSNFSRTKVERLLADGATDTRWSTSQSFSAAHMYALSSTPMSHDAILALLDAAVDTRYAERASTTKDRPSAPSLQSEVSCIRFPLPPPDPGDLVHAIGTLTARPLRLHENALGPDVRHALNRDSDERRRPGTFGARLYQHQSIPARARKRPTSPLVLLPYSLSPRHPARNGKVLGEPPPTRRR